jgi:hypothetical protein
MTDDAYTDPAMIRATYAARGRNAKLNIQKAESLGIHASSVSPTQGSNPAGGSGGTGVAASGSQVLDPTLYVDPGTTFEGGTYEGSLYQKLLQLEDTSLF